MKRKVTLLVGLAPTLWLAACAANANKYPSLAIRDAERVSGTAQPSQPEAEPPPAPPVSADLKARIGRLVEDARRAHSRFTTQSAGTSRTVASARGSSAPSDRWIEANAALAGLQAQRSQTVISLAEIDGLYADERLANPERMTPTADALSSARTEVAEWVEAEDQVIRRLSRQLGA